MNPKNFQIFFQHSGHSKAGAVWPTITNCFNLNSKTIEGVRTAEAVLKLSKKLKVEMPIVEAISQIIKGKIEPNDAVQLLLSRPLKIE